MIRIASSLLVAALAGTALANPGDPLDAYIFGDGTNQVYQVTLGGVEVLNPRTANSHFAISSDVQFISPYRATWGGQNNNFYIGGFGGLTEIDGNTGAFVKQIGSGQSLDVQISYTGTTLYRGSGNGIDEHDIATGAYIRTLTGGIGAGGAHLMKSRGNRLYVSGWNASAINVYDQVSGNLLSSLSPAPFQVQALEFDAAGNFYASAPTTAPRLPACGSTTSARAPGRCSPRPTRTATAAATRTAPTGSRSALTATSTWPTPPATLKSSTA